MKKLLFIKRKYSPYGGAEIYLHRIISLLKKKFEIHLVCQTWTNIEGVIIHKLPKINFFSDLFFALLVDKFLKNNSFRYDLIISFDRCISQDIYRASDGCHLRWLYQRQFFEDLLKKFFLKINLRHKILIWLEKKCLTISNKIITNSLMVKNDYKNFYGNYIFNKCEVCYNGIDIKKFYPFSFKEKIKLKRNMNLDDSHILLFVGSGYTRKGLKPLLKALTLLPFKYKLLVIGKDKNIKKFQTLIDKLKLNDRVFILGPKKDMLKYYHLADIFVLPTFYDPFSNACLEALSCGLPVITTIANGVSEIISDGQEGFVLKDFSNIVENLAIFIKRSFDNLSFMSNCARKKAEQFSLDIKINEFLNKIELK